MIHNGYFSQDKKGHVKDTDGESKADDDTYNLIMRDKETLLDINVPLRFIFSHTALREGWDNPNVFQICTLNETKSELKKRQEIGRGLRLAVNQDGLRVRDKNINRLTVIANESYNDFAKALIAKAAPLKDRIIFTGFIPYSEIPCYLQIANVAVIPSVWDDPFPTTVLEAQAMGLPVISTRRGGIPEEVTPETAILLDTDNHFVENLANAILDLYEHPEKRRAMSEAALKRSKLFSKERYAREFFKALEGV